MKNYLLNFIMLLIAGFGLATMAQAQEIFQVEAGTDGIGTALLDAQNGDIIELTTSGGEYLEGTDSIFVDVTIRAAAGLAEKPVIKGGGADQSLNVIEVHEGGLTLQGLKFDGGAYVIYVKAPATVQSDGFQSENLEL